MKAKRTCFFVNGYIAICGRQVKVLCRSHECYECHDQPGNPSHQRHEQDGPFAQDEAIRAGKVPFRL